jgi:hypothetical protein
MILDFLAERICQAGVAPICHAQRKIVALYEAVRQFKVAHYQQR